MVLNSELVSEQKLLCEKYSAAYCPVSNSEKIGITGNIKEGVKPINGLRHPPEEGTTGWYIWAGEEISDSPDFFMPLHIEHISEWCPEVQKYLGLPPGWRFLIDGEYEDVWYDDSLLQIET